MPSEFFDAQPPAWVVRLLLEPDDYLAGQERDTESGLDDSADDTRHRVVA